MVRWFAREWDITPLGWRIFLAMMALVCCLNVAEGIYIASDGYDAITVTVLRVAKVCFVLILPFILATKARRRGRRFGLWLILSMVFNPIVMAVVYWSVNRRDEEQRKIAHNSCAVSESAAE